MIVIGRVVAVAVQHPCQILCKTMRMAMLDDHLEMILDRLQDCWSMGRGWQNRPDDQRQAEQGRKRLPSKCRQGFHHSCLPVPAIQSEVVLLYPPGEDTVVL